MFEDWDLIVSSFLSQYGLRIRTKEFETVSWDEFKALIAGLSPETALGRVVAIRSETDKDIIKHYTKDQRRIYDDWRNREMKISIHKALAGLDFQLPVAVRVAYTFQSTRPSRASTR